MWKTDNFHFSSFESVYKLHKFSKAMGGNDRQDTAHFSFSLFLSLPFVPAALGLVNSYSLNFKTVFSS